MSGSKKAVVIGATGLIGKELINQLLKNHDFVSIKAVVRRSMDWSDPKLHWVVIEDFDDLLNHAKDLEGTHFFCALGTTMKQAGSKEAFRKVDYDYPLDFAKIAHSQSEFQQFLIVSATGANANAWIFYNRVKGELEKELESKDLGALKIFQPSLLLGDRKESRLGEQIGAAFVRFVSFFRFGTRKMWGGVGVVDVSKAMIKVAEANNPGLERFSSDQMIDLVEA